MAMMGRQRIRASFSGLLLLLVSSLATTAAFAPASNGFGVRSTSSTGSSCNIISRISELHLFNTPNNKNANAKNINMNMNMNMEQVKKGVLSAFVAASLVMGTVFPVAPSLSASAEAADGAAIGTCLLNKCKLPLAKCIANPKCLANVICINTCNGKADEMGCQIKCGDIFENDVVGEFNKCAVSDMDCVPQRQDDGSYPVPAPSQLVSKFDTNIFNGRWYISAGQNKLFDIFPCQVHFFTETAPGKFFGKLNWQIEEPDGELFTRDAIQRFIQDPKQPGHLINHDNEYLHYEDDWYVLDYEYDDNKDGVPPFVLIYYRGSNDAWVGYGGAVVYTRAAALPDSLVPRLREAVQKVNFDWDKDFAVTDNSCRAIGKDESILLKEKFAGKMAIQTEQQLLQQAVRVRGNAGNSVKAQQLFISDELSQATNAFEELSAKTREFESEIVKDVTKLENEVVKDVSRLENEVVKDVKFAEDKVLMKKR